MTAGDNNYEANEENFSVFLVFEKNYTVKTRRRGHIFRYPSPKKVQYLAASFTPLLYLFYPSYPPPPPFLSKRQLQEEESWGQEQLNYTA